MKKIQTMLTVLVVCSAALWPLACGKNISPTSTGATPTATPTLTPNSLAGFDWGAALANNVSPGSTQFSQRYSHTSVVYNNAMWVIGGESSLGVFDNDVWSSTDGVNWTPVLGNNPPGTTQFSPRSDHTSVVFNNAMWVIGGDATGAYSPDLWSSTNGSTWTQAAPGAHFSGRYDHTSLVYNGAMWVIGGISSGGFLNDVWSSPDGVNWTNVLTNNSAPGTNQFSQRDILTSLVFNNTMWVIGGWNGSTYFGDVWYSTNGLNWYEATASAPFGGRIGMTSFVYNGAMWVTGGYNGSVYLNDVWYSTNGVNWTEANAGAAFTKSAFSTGLVYNNAMWIIGGQVPSGLLNSVWTSPY
ncbi:MAG TPA: hypothetical protein VN963_07885 [bacterium]|nr:hypothetical protein [bacterium]